MRRITVLDRVQMDAETMSFEIVFWLSIPVGRELYYANPGFSSRLEGMPPITITDPERDALRNGTVQEQFEVVSFARKDAQGNVLSPAAFQTSIATNLKRIYDNLTAGIAAFNPRVYRGTRWEDGVGWTIVTVP